MRVLIASDGTHAHLYQRMAWVRAFQACGIDALLWDITKVSAFDAFDTAEPDIFMGQSYNLDEATIKCIKERPHMKVGLRAGDWGDHKYLVDTERFNILFCTEGEIETLKRLKEETGRPDFVHIHYTPEAVEWTHNHFDTIGINAVSLMMCADTAEYSGGKYDPMLDCDLGFVGGYWPYKGQVIDKYLTPLLNPMNQYSAKIFGNQPWRHINQYCGVISDKMVKDLFCSARICPNLSEPHAQEFGFDVNERIFKILYAGGFCISDNVDGYKIFGDGVVVADSPKDFKDKVDHYLNNEQERREIATIGQDIVKGQHTGFHRIATILENFGNEDMSKDLLKQYRDYLSNE